MIKTYLKTLIFIVIISVGLLMIKNFFANAQTEVVFLSPIPDQPKINAELLKIDSIQFASLTDFDEYIFIEPKTIDNIIYKTHKYVTAKGEKGYQTIIDNGTDIISIATGVEEKERTYTMKKSSLDLKNIPHDKTY